MLSKVFPNFVRNMKEELANLKADQKPGGYEHYYWRKNHYRYQPWIMRPYVRALVAKAELAKGSLVLDLGCGQGLFTALLREAGCEAYGIDLSKEAIRSARAQYGDFFQVANALRLEARGIDAIWVRSCSLDNQPSFAHDTAVTDQILSYLKPGGVLLWAYATHAGASSSEWRQHSLKEARTHFAKYPGARVYFSLRLETLLLGWWAFSPFMTEVAWTLSRVFRCGGDLIALVTRPKTGIE